MWTFETGTASGPLFTPWKVVQNAISLNNDIMHCAAKILECWKSTVMFKTFLSQWDSEVEKNDTNLVLDHESLKIQPCVLWHLLVMESTATQKKTSKTLTYASASFSFKFFLSSSSTQNCFSISLDCEMRFGFLFKCHPRPMFPFRKAQVPR